MMLSRIYRALVENVVRSSEALNQRPAAQLITSLRSTSTGNQNSSSHDSLPTTLNVAEQLDMVWSNEIPIPEYKAKMDEPVERKRARLLYQSRKRGMLENGLLLSAFADRFLQSFSPQQLTDYDMLINLPSNDWEIYYWITGLKPVPPSFDNDIMRSLQEFVRNEHRESRAHQPDLKPIEIS